jgi:signal transduction histidine kinase
VTSPDAPAVGRRPAAALRDPALAAVFPAVLVCAEDGRLLDADPAARALLPPRARSSPWLAELLAPVRGGLAGGDSTAVLARHPDAEGIATVRRLDDEPVVVVHLRDPRSSPIVRDLAERVHLYEAVLTTGPIMVHVYDREMNSRWSTAALRPELGHQPAEPLSAEENYAFVHPDDLPPERLDPDRAADAEQLPRRIRVRNADGEWRWLAILSVDLLDDPAVGSIVVHAWDVTDEVAREEEIEASRRRLAALIDTLEEAVIVVSDGTIMYANARVSELFPSVGGHEALIGRPVADHRDAFALSMADPEAWLETGLRAVAAGEPVRGRVAETADGRILEQDFVPVRVGERETSRMWVYRDVTAQRQLERRREELLRMERAARHAAEEQNERLRELDELKTGFVATVSHELRTPLAALRSYLELLLDPAGEPLTAEQHRVVESAQRGALRLGRLVDDLLVLAQLQSRSLRVDRATVDVAAAVREAAREAASGSPGDVELAVDVDPGPPIHGDYVRLTQIVSNLLGNAFKFAQSSVRCSARLDGDRWVVEVLDDGPGIPEEELDRIFEPFFRGRAPAVGAQPGAGLGLAISSQLAERLGGSIQLENRPEGGACARLVLPLEAPAVAPEEEP